MTSANKMQIEVKVSFFSFFKDMTGCAGCTEVMPNASQLGTLIEALVKRFPKLEPMQKSMLLAVGVEYQTREYVLQDGDEVSLFPPVQGG
jgi:molybdopterin converting factor small subunit